MKTDTDKQREEIERKYRHKNRLVRRIFIPALAVGTFLLINSIYGVKYMWDNNPYKDSKAVVEFQGLNKEYNALRHIKSNLEEQRNFQLPDTFLSYMPEELKDDLKEISTQNSVGLEAEIILVGKMVGITKTLKEEKREDPQYKQYIEWDHRKSIYLTYTLFGGFALAMGSCIALMECPVSNNIKKQKELSAIYNKLADHYEKKQV